MGGFILSVYPEDDVSKYELDIEGMIRYGERDGIYIDDIEQLTAVYHIFRDMANRGRRPFGIKDVARKMKIDTAEINREYSILKHFSVVEEINDKGDVIINLEMGFLVDVVSFESWRTRMEQQDFLMIEMAKDAIIGMSAAKIVKNYWVVAFHFLFDDEFMNGDPFIDRIGLAVQEEIFRLKDEYLSASLESEIVIFINLAEKEMMTDNRGFVTKFVRARDVKSYFEELGYPEEAIGEAMLKLETQNSLGIKSQSLSRKGKVYFFAENGKEFDETSWTDKMKYFLSRKKA